eukprot:scaffold202582_cov46-Attheya_sp.AAC.4
MILIGYIPVGTRIPPTGPGTYQVASSLPGTGTWYLVLSMGKLVTILLTALVFSCSRCEAQPVRCPSDESIRGFPNLKSLDVYLKSEFAAVLTQNPYREGPKYEYILCPNTVYEVTDVPIYPLLNGTIIKCGRDGKSSDNCIIEGGDIQVAIRESTLDFYRPEFELVIFKGLTFILSKNISVGTWATESTTAWFMDCHWAGSEGHAALLNTYVPMSNDVEIHHSNRGMHVYIISSSMTKTRLKSKRFWGIANTGHMYLRNVTFEDNKGTQFIFNERGGLLDVQGSSFIRNEAMTTISTSEGANTFITDCFFVENDVTKDCWLPCLSRSQQANLLADNSTIKIHLTKFSNNSATGGDISAFSSDLYVSDSCFIGGTYDEAPVYMDAESKLMTNQNNFGENITAGNCADPPGVYLYEEASCTPFDANECSSRAGLLSVTSAARQHQLSLLLFWGLTGLLATCLA